jgi:MarR family transcriptional regulator, organic hydroperoxide resistance regulator
MFDVKRGLAFQLSYTGLRSAELFEARALRRHGVSHAMYRVLAALADHDDQRLGELAALAEVEISTLSRLIGTMQARRLVSRRRSGQDARAVRIRITGPGRALAETLITAAGEYDAAVAQALGPRQVAGLKRLLAEIGAALARLEAGRGASKRRAASTAERAGSSH